MTRVSIDMGEYFFDFGLKVSGPGFRVWGPASNREAGRESRDSSHFIESHKLQPVSCFFA